MVAPGQPGGAHERAAFHLVPRLRRRGPRPGLGPATLRVTRGAGRTVLWWGRFDPGYSRNRILRGLLGEAGWRVLDFRPRASPLGALEAALRRLPTPDLVWVPCFRQRDVAAAARWSRRRGVPLLFDPLISAYDKQVSERGKLRAGSARARRLLARERARFGAADLVLADTAAHRDYFAETLAVPPGRLAVVPVGAEEPLFAPAPPARRPGAPVEVLFFGSFIGLQGPEWIVEAARVYEGPPVSWHLLGAGPLLAACRERARGLPSVVFEPWVPYESLPARIHRADILLGVFGTGPKAGRVIPNKVYQALACGRPVITRASPAYPEALLEGKETGLASVPPGDPEALAAAVAAWAGVPERLAERGEAAHAAYRRHFDRKVVAGALEAALARLFAPGGT